MNEALGQIDFFAPRFTALPLWLFPALMAAGIGFSLWYYRDPIPPLSRGMRRTLICLRAGAFTFLFLALAEPVVGIIRTATRTFGVATVLDTSSSMEQSDDPARKQDALNALDALRTRLGDRGVFFGFGDHLYSLDEKEPVFDGSATDLAAALRSVIAERDLSACVVIGDGRWNRGEDPVSIAFPEDFPIHAVLVGSVSDTPDISLQAVSAPPVGHDGRDVPVEITVAAHGSAEGVIPVEILERGKPLISGKVALQAGSAARIVLNLPLDGLGEHTFTARAIPTFDERTTDNNARDFTIRALKSSFRTLIIAPAPSADLAFIRRTVEADSAFSVHTVISAGSSGSSFPESVNDFDIAIILDGGGFALTPERARALVRRNAAGMGLWIIGSTPPPSGSPLEETIPVVFERPAGQASSGISVSLTETGRTHFLTADGPDRDGWETLPPLSSAAPVQPANTGAVLVESAVPPQGKESLPILVAGYAGKGKTLAMPVSGIWRWRLMMEGAGKSGAFFDTFVGGAARWLATEADGSPFTVSTDANTYLGGQEAFFEGRVFDAVYQPLSGAEVSVIIDGDVSRKAILAETRPGVYAGSVRSATPGEHAWAATAFVDGKHHGDASGAFTVENFSLELLDLAPDHETLRSIASNAGGLAVTVAGIDSVLEQLTLRSFSERHEREHHLALHPIFPGMVILLLSVEWFIRKRRGMI